MRHHHLAAPLRATPSLARLAAGLRSLAAVAGLGAALLAGPARAADPQVAITVTPIPTTVTFSRPALTPPMPTYAAYRISVVNNSTNTLNNVRFTGTTAVVLANAAVRSAPFREAIGLACTPTNAARTSIECAIGQLRGGGGAGASASFTVIFDSPSSVAAPVACPAASCDQIKFATRTFYSEGANDAGGAAHLDTTDALALTNLGTPTTTEVKSFVPTGGGRFFTGVDGVPRSASNDLWTTTVSVPSVALDGAQVIESVNPASCSSDVTACFFSDVTIPGSFNGLVITLRRDASTIAKGAKIGNATIFYQHLPSLPLTAVQPCSITGGPLPGAPCMATRTEYTKRTAPTPDLVGDWEFVIHAVDNGRFAG